MRGVTLIAVVGLVSAAALDAQEQRPGAGALGLLDVVRAAMSRHPALQIQQQQVAIGDALRQQASGAFDRVIDAAADHGRLYLPRAPATGPASLSLAPTTTSDLAASYSKLLRSGVLVRGVADVQRVTDTQTRLDGLTTSHVGLQLVFPLMRGRGQQTTTALERAADLERDSSVLEVRHVTAQLMTNVVSSYWGLVAAQRQLAVATASAERGELLVENMRTLIAADQTPRNDLSSALANLADREAAQFAAEQARIEARQQLILDMGVRQEEFPEQAALDEFPELMPLPEGTEPSGSLDALVEEALQRRADYAAVRMRVEAARVLRDAAQNGLLPEVNLSLDVGYAGLSEGRAFSRYFAGLGSRVQGPDIVARVSYQLPAQNSVALGRLAQADALLRQAELRATDVAREVRSSVVAAVSGWQNALLRVQKARDSVNAFRAALDGERDKLALGVGSIVNLLTIEDRLTAASEREVAAWRSYGESVVQLRFASGALVPLHDPMPTLTESTFTTVPHAPPAKKE
jgi:outer membrane protein